MAQNLIPPSDRLTRPLRASRAAIAALVAGLCITLLGCGGGGGTAALGSTLSLNGTAATGAAIANATVRFRCNSTAAIVSATATTDASGAYSKTIADAAYPCLLQVTDSKGNQLHSYANADGAAHLTPLTDAVLAAALGQPDLSSTFANFGTTQVTALQSALTQGKPALAWTALKTQLQAAGVSVGAIGASPFTDSLQADAAHVHTGHDKLLDDAATYAGDPLYRMAAGLTVPPVRATGLLNDTGIDWCSENITTPGTWVNNVVCATYSWVANLWGRQQDAFFGRDAQAKAGTLQKVGSGMAGFDFTRLGSNGRPLVTQNGTWSDSGTEAAGTRWDCVRDNVTGLWWEVKSNDANHLRHKDHTYTWFNPTSTTNGGAVGTEASSTCKGVAAETKCNTQSYVTAVNAAGLCGKTDWRMPTMDELSNLAHTGRTAPAIDTNYFPNSASDWFWSSLPDAGGTGDAWGVNFGYGGDVLAHKSRANRVRLVRSGQ